MGMIRKYLYKYMRYKLEKRLDCTTIQRNENYGRGYSPAIGTDNPAKGDPGAAEGVLPGLQRDEN